MLDCLVHADGTAGHNALPCIFRGASRRVLADRDGLDRDQDTFGVQAVGQRMQTDERCLSDHDAH